MRKSYVWIFLALLATYVILTLSLPTDPQLASRFGISHLGLRLLGLTVTVPLVLIYLSALYGFVRVKEYAESIKETKEGPYFRYLANGLAVLGFSLPIYSIIGSVLSYVRHANPALLPEITITRQYVALVLAGVAVLLIDKGARGLFSTLKRVPKDTLSDYKIVAAVILSSIYTWLIVAQSQSVQDASSQFLPVGLLIITIAIPYVLIWYLGAGSAIRLYTYQAHVKGTVYKRAIDSLAKGVAIIMLISILLQFLGTLSGILNRLDLSPLLAVVYFLIILYLLGYGLVARGAKRLKQIEEA